MRRARSAHQLGSVIRAVVCATALIATIGAACAQTLAPTPPMGWNSWDAFGTTVREPEVKANADAMAALKRFGWQYIVVDIQWYEPNAQAHGYRDHATLAMDRYGRLIPAANRFPSSGDGQGFKALADYVHARGLKFGIHILRGIPRQAVEQNTPVLGSSAHAADIADRTSTCDWNTDMWGVDMTKPGAQAYYDSLVAMYAAWGVDFIKADDMTRPYHAAEIDALHAAIEQSGRPIVLSLSPGPAPLAQVDSLRRDAQMWRIEDDLWDDWKSVRAMAARLESWAPFIQPGHWPDADMLPLGHIGLRAERGNDRLSSLTHDEQRTLMTLWCMARSPLIFGGDLATLDPFTRSLLTNADVLEIDQHSENNRLAYKSGDVRVWTATSTQTHTRGAAFVAVVNLGDKPETVDIPWTAVGLGSPVHPMRDLWTGETSRAASTLKQTLQPHSAALFRINP